MISTRKTPKKKPVKKIIRRRKKPKTISKDIKQSIKQVVQVIIEAPKQKSKPRTLQPKATSIRDNITRPPAFQIIREERNHNNDFQIASIIASLQQEKRQLTTPQPIPNINDNRLEMLEKQATDYMDDLIKKGKYDLKEYMRRQEQQVRERQQRDLDLHIQREKLEKEQLIKNIYDEKQKLYPYKKDEFKQELDEKQAEEKTPEPAIAEEKTPEPAKAEEKPINIKFKIKKNATDVMTGERIAGFNDKLEFIKKNNLKIEDKKGTLREVMFNNETPANIRKITKIFNYYGIDEKTGDFIIGEVV